MGVPFVDMSDPHPADDLDAARAVHHERLAALDGITTDDQRHYLEHVDELVDEFTDLECDGPEPGDDA